MIGAPPLVVYDGGAVSFSLRTGIKFIEFGKAIAFNGQNGTMIVFAEL